MKTWYVSDGKVFDMFVANALENQIGIDFERVGQQAFCARFEEYCLATRFSEPGLVVLLDIDCEMAVNKIVKVNLSH